MSRKTIKISLVFDDWTKEGKPIYNTEEGVDLSLGIFHSGSTFEGTISLNEDDAEELIEAMEKGYQPQFWITKKG